MKKKLAAGLIGIMVLSLLGGCAGKSDGNTNGNTGGTTAADKALKHIEGQVMNPPKRGPVTQYIMYNGQKAELVGDSIAEDCFFGDYYAEDMDYISLPLEAPVRKQFDYTLTNGDLKLSELPVEIKFGRGYYYQTPSSHVESFDIVTADSVDNKYKMSWLQEEYDSDSAEILYKNYFIAKHIYTAELCFVDEESDFVGGYMKDVLCMYEIDGDTINFQGIEPREDNGYDLLDFKYSCQYSFDNIDLVFSKDGKEIRLNPDYGWKLKNTDHTNFTVTAAPTSLDNSYSDVAFIKNIKTEAGEIRNEVVLSDLKKAVDPEIDFGMDGKFKISWKQVKYTDEYYKTEIYDEPGEISASYIGRGGHDGLVIIDGGKAYAYSLYAPEEDYKAMVTAGVVTDKESKDLSEEEASAIVSKQKAAAERINDSISSNDNISFSRLTGEVVMNSGLLFGYDKDELEDSGKKTLDDFLKSYISVIKELKDEGLINGVKIFGYTDSNGTYEYNKTLSEKRAENVAKYISENYPDVKDIFEYEGRASDNLVYNPDGTVDDEASRRVTFDLVISGK